MEGYLNKKIPQNLEDITSAEILVVQELNLPLNQKLNYLSQAFLKIQDQDIVNLLFYFFR